MWLTATKEDILTEEISQHLFKENTHYTIWICLCKLGSLTQNQFKFSPLKIPNLGMMDVAKSPGWGQLCPGCSS